MLFFRKKKTTVEFVPVVMPDPIDHSVPRKKILVVDDDPITVKTLSLTLNAKGYEVLSATDGSEAISIIREQNPDMMLVDVGLPPDLGGARLSDGFQVTWWLQRANPRKIPAIIISGSDKPAYKQQAAAIGADGFMSKPLNKELLLNAIESALANPTPVVGEVPVLKMAGGSFAS